MNNFRVYQFILLPTRPRIWNQRVFRLSTAGVLSAQRVLVAGVIGILFSGCSLFQTGNAPQAQAEQVLARVESFEANGDYSEALSLLEELLRDHPAFSESQAGRAERLRSTLQHLGAAQAHLEAGNSIDAEKEFDKAMANYPDLVDERPEYSELHNLLLEPLLADAEAALESHDDKKLVELYAKIREVRPLDSQEWLHAGQAHENLGDVEKAQESFESILEEAPEYAEARSRLARLAHSDGDLERARAELERARGAAPENIPVATHYAEICALLNDLDAAVATWKKVAELQPENPQPFKIIGQIEATRQRWEEAGNAYRECIRRTNEPSHDLLLKVAETYGRAGREEQTLDVYVDVLEGVEGQAHGPAIGENLRRTMLKKLWDLGYVHHQGEWIPKKRLFAEGWVFSRDVWVRPEEARLREVAHKIEKERNDDFRALGDANYAAAAKAKQLLKGMKRREMIKAWGFFEDQNVFQIPESDVVYEQLLFSNGRQIYLRNGLVCFWSN